MSEDQAVGGCLPHGRAFSHYLRFSNILKPCKGGISSEHLAFTTCFINTPEKNKVEPVSRITAVLVNHPHHMHIASNLIVQLERLLCTCVDLRIATS